MKIKWHKNAMITQLVRPLPDLLFLWKLQILLFMVSRWWGDVKLLAVGPDGGLNALKHVIFCHSVMEQHLTPYTYTAIARDPIRESTPNFAIRFIVEQILRICCYLKIWLVGSLNNRAQSFRVLSGCRKKLCARLLSDPTVQILR